MRSQKRPPLDSRSHFESLNELVRTYDLGYKANPVWAYASYYFNHLTSSGPSGVALSSFPTKSLDLKKGRYSRKKTEASRIPSVRV